MRSAALFPSRCISLFAVENKFNVYHHQITSKSECAGLGLKLKLRSITLNCYFNWFIFNQVHHSSNLCGTAI